MTLSYLKENPIIQKFFGRFQEGEINKVSKYLIIIAIDYLSKYFKNKTIDFQCIQELASSFFLDS